MVIQSYAYVENLVNLSWHVDPPNFPIGSNVEIKLNDMIITGTKYEKCEGPYPMFRGYGNWSCVRGFIVMKRLMLFHVIQTYVPTGMLVWISWMSFWLDPRASPARITLTITTLLTLTTMSNGARQGKFISINIQLNFKILFRSSSSRLHKNAGSLAQLQSSLNLPRSFGICLCQLLSNKEESRLRT